MSTATVQMDMSVQADTFERYERLAERTGHTRTWYMNRALDGSIDQLEYEFGILQQVEDWRAGRLKTYSSDEVRERLGMDG